ncbi:MAG: sugar phosphate isomerase/epimerase [Victivallales bacterium]|nr:sugar phosphate isomerase/epimerase [Victivallales bacterium]
MISYALSSCAFGNYVTEEAANAIRQSKIRNYELFLGTYLEDNEKTSLSRKLSSALIKEGVLRPASVHLPFFDPSFLYEDRRKMEISRLIKLIRDNAELMGPMVTLHASGEPPLEEHPQRIGQVCKSIEDMLPLAQEMGFVINVEFLPRTCVGNSAEELQEIVSHFDADKVGICLDVNHIMNKYLELPAMIDLLAPRIRSFHICDYDGIDENHWLPGQGIHNWPELMRHIKAIDHDLLLILETSWQLQSKTRPIDPIFSLRQNECACWFLENCDRIMAEQKAFRIPGN